MEVIMQIGKNGITETALAEIKGHIKRKKTVKVRFLKAFLTSTKREEAQRKIEEAIQKKGKLVGHVLMFE